MSLLSSSVVSDGSQTEPDYSRRNTPCEKRKISIWGLQYCEFCDDLVNLVLLDRVKYLTGSRTDRSKAVLLCFCSFLCLLCLCARLFICALWSSAGKGLTSWLSFVVSTVSLLLSHWYPGSGVVLDCIDS